MARTGAHTHEPKPLVKECVPKNKFSYLATKTYVVGAQKNRFSSFEHPKHVLKLMGKKIFIVLC